MLTKKVPKSKKHNNSKRTWNYNKYQNFKNKTIYGLLIKS